MPLAKVPSVNGGNCDPLPNPEEEDLATTQNLLDLCPEERITIQNKCYEVKGLHRWIIEENKKKLPFTQTEITTEEKQILIQAYEALPKIPVSTILTRDKLIEVYPNLQHETYIRLNNRDYTDIALGAARLFGIELFNNFSYPYFSKSINEFWKRWHISLTSWFRDYIYIPMGGNRVNPIRKIINTIVVFLISGFWHGANWTYISWGFLNSIFILPKTLSQKKQSIDSNKMAGKVVGAIQMLLTFLTVSILWVFFRSKTVYDALKYLQNLTYKWNSILPDFNGRKSALVLSIIIFAFMIFEWIGKSHNCPLVFTNSFKNKWLKWGFYYAIIFSILYFYRGNDPFIYFQF